MSGKERREQILNILKDSGKPVPGVELARLLQVSRQVIVQDMALLRANGVEILSTNRGYVAVREHSFSRVFKVIHTEEQVEEELNLYVDFGGTVEDVFVYHKVYGVIRAEMNIKSRMDVKKISPGYLIRKIHTADEADFQLPLSYHFCRAGRDSGDDPDRTGKEGISGPASGL